MSNSPADPNSIQTPSGRPVGDRWIKCISAHGNIRAVAIQATRLIDSMAQMHRLSGDSAQALGESVIGALLVASYCKNQEHVNLNIQSTGVVRQALVDAHPDGRVRGYVIEQPKDMGMTMTENAGPWGDGTLSVLRTKSAEHQQPYIGTVPLITGYLAKDLTFYWAQSEQVPSSVGIATQVKDGKVIAAGGFLVQAMPGATAAELKSIEKHINEIQSLADRLENDADPVALLSQIFQDSTFHLVEEKALEFSCNCSWERVNRALILVGAAELKAMLAEDHEASIHCDFCTKEYKVDAAGLQKLIEAAGGSSST